MRYPCLCGILVLVFLLCGDVPLHAQDDSLSSRRDAWEATYANGATLSPIRSLGRDADTLAAILFRSRVTRFGDTSIVYRSYEPLMIPLDSIRNLRVSDGNHMGIGVLVGVVAGALIGYAADEGEAGRVHTRSGSGSDLDIDAVLIGAGVGTLAGILVGGAIQDETVYNLDPLTPDQRRALVHVMLAPASAEELSSGIIDTTVVAGEEWGHLWTGAGAGPAVWSSMEEGRNTLVPRFTFGVEFPYFFLTGALSSSSVRWFRMTELDLLAGKQFAADPFTVAVAAGPCFIRSQVTELMPNPVEEFDFKRSGSAIGGALSLDLTLPVTAYLGVSVAACSSISKHGPMFGLGLSAKIGSFR